MDKVLPYLFFMAWMLCGCSSEKILDDWRACIIAVTALIVIIIIGVATAEEMDEI